MNIKVITNPKVILSICAGGLLIEAGVALIAAGLKNNLCIKADSKDIVKIIEEINKRKK